MGGEMHGEGSDLTTAAGSAHVRRRLELIGLLTRRALLGAASVAALAAIPARAQDAALVEAAKKEGTVVWYSGMIVNQVLRPLADGMQHAFDPRTTGLGFVGHDLLTLGLWTVAGAVIMRGTLRRLQARD